MNDLEEDKYRDVDLASRNFVSKWPVWLRWVLFIPAGILMAFVASFAYGIFIFLGSLFYNPAPTTWWSEILRSAIFSAAFVYVGAFVAPKNQFMISIVMLVILALPMGFGGIGAFFFNEVFWDVIINWSYILASLAAGIGIVIHIKNET